MCFFFSNASNNFHVLFVFLLNFFHKLSFSEFFLLRHWYHSNLISVRNRESSRQRSLCNDKQGVVSWNFIGLFCSLNDKFLMISKHNYLYCYHFSVSKIRCLHSHYFMFRLSPFDITKIRHFFEFYILPALETIICLLWYNSYGICINTIKINQYKCRIVY